jgi:hypothetical protein
MLRALEVRKPRRVFNLSRQRRAVQARAAAGTLSTRARKVTLMPTIIIITTITTKDHHVNIRKMPRLVYNEESRR